MSAVNRPGPAGPLGVDLIGGEATEQQPAHPEYAYCDFVCHGGLSFLLRLLVQVSYEIMPPHVMWGIRLWL